MKNAPTGTAAEGLPTLTRRSLLARTAIAIPAMGMAAIRPAEAAAIEASPHVAAALARYRLADAGYAIALEAQEAMEASPDCPQMPVWVARGRAGADLGLRMVFHSVEHAQEYCDSLIAKHRAHRQGYTDEEWGGAGLANGHNAYLARIAEHRDEAMAVLQRIEEEYTPLLRLEDAADEAYARCADAFDTLISEPCTTLADVKAKAAAMLSARSSFGGQLEYSESEALLRSFMTAGGVS